MLNDYLLLDGLRLLVVDDDPDTISLLTFLFEADGAELIAANSASEALQALKFFKADILISDIKLPEEDGYALIAKIRTLDAERGGNIPAIAMSGYVRDEDSREALSAGYDAHIAKPVNLDELVEVVTTLAARTGVLRGMDGSAEFPLAV
ncbi:response regulator [Microcoleus sp. FACHB-672]|uniref:response regulator n=1 Tax=Microcoleus sp. FACHB-672 TaxID=2692825 RepID=UPI00168898DE|nr:response regulator [Microcoleus sp. FACHB-672]MBD2039390.1 response regulator [Microcoleus sp. FACHB-672]